jgi:hypothetical protein
MVLLRIPDFKLDEALEDVGRNVREKVAVDRESGQVRVAMYQLFDLCLSF